MAKKQPDQDGSKASPDFLLEESKSLSMQSVLAQISPAARVNVPILLMGESGTGKEIMARHIHTLSARCDKTFLAINCAAIPENLIESHLFGYARGAFSGAIVAQPGIFRAAKEGTVFLDEIGDMPIAQQAKLLRVIQEKKVMPVGDHQEYPADVRIITATNRDLDDMVKKGQFREDLYYRLTVMKVKLPALRQRREDIPVLASLVLQQHIKEGNLPPSMTISEGALEVLKTKTWLGNIRELSNNIAAAGFSALSKHTMSIEADDLRCPGLEDKTHQKKISGNFTLSAMLNEEASCPDGLSAVFKENGGGQRLACVSDMFARKQSFMLPYPRHQ